MEPSARLAPMDCGVTTVLKKWTEQRKTKGRGRRMRSKNGTVQRTRMAWCKKWCSMTETLRKEQEGGHSSIRSSTESTS